MSLGRRLLLALLLVDALLLAVLELFFLPLRLPVEQGGWILPLAPLLAALTTPLLVRAAADLAPGRLGVAGAPLGVWLVAVLLLGVLGPGGDSLFPDDLRPLLLLVAGVVPAALVLGRLAAAAVERATAVPGVPVAAGGHPAATTAAPGDPRRGRPGETTEDPSG